LKERLDYQPTASLLYCLTARNMANQLSKKEVQRILGQKYPSATTDELYTFGLEMVKEASERYQRYDEKATKIAGYAGAIVALLVSEFSKWSGAIDWWAMPFVFGAALLGLISAALGLSAISLREIESYSPRDWIREDQLANPDRLRRYHILTMYVARQSFIVQSQHKSKRVRQAQWTLVAAGTILLFALLDASALKLHGLGSHKSHAVASAVTKETNH
jgi:hypothetical protein